MSTLDKIASAIREHQLLSGNAPVIVGVSGGPDSLCLLHALHRLGHRVVVAHFNHGLRAEAAQEAQDVADLAQKLSLPCAIEAADVATVARAQGQSIEECGRQLRYAFLFEQARDRGAQAVAVGHTADDQAETVLMHLIRGAGLDGLKGMTHRVRLAAFSTIPLIRPLLDVWRGDTLEYCRQNALAPHFDPTNESPAFLRNRIRHQLIPQLQDYNPRIRDVLWRTARSLAVDHELLQEYVRDIWAETTVEGEEGVFAFDETRLRALSPGLQRHLLRTACEALDPTVEIDQGDLDRAVAFLAVTSAGTTPLAGGLVLAREAGRVLVGDSQRALAGHAWPQLLAEAESIDVAIPGLILLAAGWVFKADEPVSAESARRSFAASDNAFEVWVDAERLPPRLGLRGRHDGDRFRPLGLQGHSQKLSDFLVNEKMPLRARDRWPLLCDGEVVIWVPGYRPAEDFKIRNDTRRAVRFSVSRAM